MNDYKNAVANKIIDNIKDKILYIVMNYFGSWDNLIQEIEQSNIVTASISKKEAILVILNLLAIYLNVNKYEIMHNPKQYVMEVKQKIEKPKYIHNHKTDSIFNKFMRKQITPNNLILKNVSLDPEKDYIHKPLRKQYLNKIDKKTSWNDFFETLIDYSHSIEDEKIDSTFIKNNIIKIQEIAINNINNLKFPKHSTQDLIQNTKNKIKDIIEDAGMRSFRIYINSKQRG